jgi:release factor glutamine methyltransferase
MTVREALARAEAQVAQTENFSPRRDAETLLLRLLDRDRAWLLTHQNDGLTPELVARYEAAVRRRASGEPIQYITGHQEFFGLDFLVDERVLIPRPETEHLVEAALGLARNLPAPRIIDVGTGSGCIAIALAHSLPDAEIFATDISDDALSVAGKNALRLGVSVNFSHADVLDGFSGAPAAGFDLVVSNPPYVGRNESDKVQRQVKDFEPDTAVFAGESGLDIYRCLIPQAQALLKPGGGLLMEIGYSIEQPVRDLLTSGWSDLRTVPDLQGIPRVVLARKSATQ